MYGSDLDVLEHWAKSRNADAFAELVSRYAGLVYTACLRILHNPADAEDITQECFLELAQRPPAVRSSLAGWLHRVATHRALNRVRSDSRRRERERRFHEESVQPHATEWDECAGHIDEAIATLRPGLRDVVVLRYLRGYSQEEVGRSLDIAPRTVRHRQQQAIGVIRKHLRRRGIAVGPGLATLLGVHLANSASAEALPETLQATLGRMALSGIVPRPVSGVAKALRLLAESSVAKTAGALVVLALLLAGGTSMYRAGQAEVAAQAPRTNEKRVADAAEVPPAAKAVAPAADRREASPAHTSTPHFTAVVTDPDGRPVAGAVLSSDGAGDLATSDAEGRLSVGMFPEGARQLALDAPDYETCMVNNFPLRWTAPVRSEIVLVPPLVREIRVLDEQWRPVSGAEVLERRTRRVLGKTDDDGAFQPSGTWTNLVAVHPVLGEVDVAVQGDGVAMVLPRGEVLARVTWAGAPVPGAVLSLDSGRSVSTGEDGTATIDGLSAYDEVAVHAELACEDGRSLFGTALVTPQAGKTVRCDIALEDPWAATLIGRVLWEDGAPAEDARIRVFSATNYRRFATAEMGSGGYFEAPLFDGMNRIVEYALNAPWVDLDAASIVVSQPGETIERKFRLKHPKPSEAADDVEVVLDYLGDSVPERLMVCTDAWWLGPSYYWIAPPEDGVLHLDVASQGALQCIVVVDPENGRAGRWLNRGQSGVRRASVRLDVPVGTVRGVLRDTQGEPIAYGHVRSGGTGFTAAFCVADSAGAFALWPVPTGTPFHVRVEAPGCIEYLQAWEAKQRPNELRLTLERRDSVVAGRVVYDDGTPVTAGVVRWNGELIASILDGAFRLAVPSGRGVLVANDGRSATEPVTVVAPSTSLVLTLASPEAGSRSPAEIQEAREGLMQFGLIFKMFAGEDESNLLPPLSPVDGAFYPEIGKIYPDYLTNAVLLARVTGQGPVKLCYLGHLLDSEEAALTFLDAYAELGAETVSGSDIEVAEGQGSLGGDTLLRISESVVDPITACSIPIMWELPRPEGEAGGVVLYLDGHVQWQPYPGEFPMTEAVIERIQALRSDTMPQPE